ncbi:hypothetical protein H4582DRAFT_2077903 [Lactarius indigo]|nr:hypothetical protein H4582DRAFT_2077903 [Lactarius indigo]
MPRPPTRHHAATTWGPRPRLLQLNTTPPPYGTQDPAAVAAGLHATPVRRAGPRHHRPSAPPQRAHHHRRHDPNTPRKSPSRAVKTRHRRPSVPPQRANHHRRHAPSTPRKSPPRADTVFPDDEVEAILDSRHFGRRKKLQYLIKWKGYSDSENQWVDKDDVFAPDAIKAYQEGRTGVRSLKSQPMNDQGEYPSHLRSIQTSMPTSPLRHVTTAILLDQVAQDAANLIEDNEETVVQQVQLTPYTSANIRAGHITAQEWANVLQRFPDPTHQPDDEQQHAVAHIFRDDNGNREPVAIIPPGDDLIGTRGILPADRPLEDPTGVRSSGGLAEDGEGVGRRTTALSAEEIERVAAAQAALPNDEAHADNEDYYPVRHPLLRTHSHPTNPRITPWLVHTDGTPMPRGRVRLPGVAFHTPITHDDDPAQVLAPEGFRANRQPHYIHFPITGPDGVERNASHVQIVGGANPFVLGLIPGSPHLYGKPLYAFPMLSAAGRAFIAHEDLVILASDRITDRALNRIGDESLTAEVTRYRAAAYEEERLAARIRQLQAMRLAARDDKRDCIYRLERANVFERISNEQSTWTARDFRRLRLFEVQVGQTPVERNIKTKILIVAYSTRDQWTSFRPYHIERRGDRNVPTRFLGAAQWRERGEDTGYFVEFNGPNRFRPVEFNFEHLCWTEVTWNPIDHRWDIVRPAGRNYNCDIDARELNSRADYGPIDGQAQEHTDEGISGEEASESQSPSRGTTPAEEASLGAIGDHIIQRTESLTINQPEPEVIHIHSPAVAMATATITHEELLTTEARDQIALEEQRRIAEESRANLAPINPYTGHRMTEDDVAIHRAIGPDVADPPSGGGGPPNDLPRGGGPPPGGPGFGGFPGGFPGGPPGGGPPGGGLPGAGPIVPPPSNKLAGEAPTVFDGERAKVEAFLTQWHVYWGMNADEGIMATPYRRALLFLSYIKGVNVSEWVLTMLTWLNGQIQAGIPRTSEGLWNEVTRSFMQRFRNTMEQEQAQYELKKGVKMIGGNLDEYCTQFEQLIRRAQYRLDDPQTLDLFASGLPKDLYEKVYTLDNPRNYREWKEAATTRQQHDNNDNGRDRQGVHGNQEIYEIQTPWIPPPTGFEGDLLEQRTYSLRVPHTDPGEDSSKEEEDQEPEVATRAVQDVPPQQRASDWLNGVAGESDDVKDIILQQLWKKEGFQDA